MALNSKMFFIVGNCLLALAFIFYVVSNAVPSWGKISVVGYDSTVGLWKSCSSGQCVPYCQSNAEQSETACKKILAARAFVTLACILSAISILLLFGAMILNENSRRITTVIGKSLAFFCVIIGIIGVAIGINVITDTGTSTKLSWGPAAIIGVIAIIVNFGGAVAALFIA